MSEVIPMAATSLLMPALCIVFDVDSVSAVLAPFASSIAFLFIGSWMFVAALQKHGQWGDTILVFTGGLALEADFPNLLGRDHGVQFRIFSAGVHWIQRSGLCHPAGLP